MKSRFLIPELVVLSSLIFVTCANAQVVNGVDYGARDNPANTYEMTHTDILGQRFDSEYLTLKDDVTGAQIIALTTSRHSNSKYYQTHPSWTPDGKHIVFRSSRGKQDGQRFGGFAYAISMDTYDITQVTTDDWGTNLHLGWKKNLAYFFHKGQLKALNLGQLLSDSAKNKVGPPDSYLTVLGTLPEGMRASDMGLDAMENRAFFTGRLESGSAIYSIDFKSGDLTKLLDAPFRTGHLQANPYVTGEIMYCWETGGDAPQRMWYLSVDQNGKVNNRPIYVEKPTEWITHEVFINADHIQFNVMAHLDRLRENPTGIFTLNIRTNEVKNHGQIEKGGYWHNDGTEDGKYIVGDSFDGDLYRIDTKTGKQTLLTTGHRPNSEGPFTSEAHSHHNISPDDKWVLLNSSMLTDNDIMLVPLHPDRKTGMPSKP
ncbi:MAG: oligogalacturonide lyase [Candidatus Pelagisphaera sp.]|jgi:oligogalacturonide lyase